MHKKNVVFCPSSTVWLYGEFKYVIDYGKFKGATVNEIFGKDICIWESFIDDTRENREIIAIDLQNSISVELSKNIKKLYIDNLKNDCERILNIILSLLDCLPWYDALVHHYVKKYGYSSTCDFWKKATKKELQNLSRILTDEISKTTCIFI